MNPIAEKYIAAAKHDFLMREGLTRKEYSPYTHYTDEYPECQYDSKTDTTLYYRVVPISVSEEEFWELREASKYREVKKEESSNGVSIALKVIAWIIFIGGLILGLVLGSESGSSYSSRDEFDFLTALSSWATSFVSGMIVLGFAEIIKILNDIKYRL